MWEEKLKENGCVDMYNWITLLDSRNYCSFINQLYFSKTFLKWKKKGRLKKISWKIFFFSPSTFPDLLLLRKCDEIRRCLWSGRKRFTNTVSIFAVLVFPLAHVSSFYSFILTLSRQNWLLFLCPVPVSAGLSGGFVHSRDHKVQALLSQLRNFPQRIPCVGCLSEEMEMLFLMVS